MEILAGVSVVVLVLAALTIAIKTLALWRRSRGLPELLLSLMLISATVLGYPLMIASTLIPPSDLRPVHLAAQLAMAFGYACLLLFTKRVFRAKSPWATGLALVTLAGIVLGSVLYSVELRGEHPRRPAEMIGLTLFNSATIAVAYFWTMLESLGYYRQLRLRLRLGLSDVVVTNRVLLWGLMSLAAGFAVVINALALLAGAFMSAPVVAVSSVLGLAHAGCLFLAFDPPAWYKAWITTGAGAEQHAEA